MIGAFFCQLGIQLTWSSWLSHPATCSLRSVIVLIDGWEVIAIVASSEYPALILVSWGLIYLLGKQCGAYTCWTCLSLCSVLIYIYVNFLDAVLCGQRGALVSNVPAIVWHGTGGAFQYCFLCSSHMHSRPCLRYVFITVTFPADSLVMPPIRSSCSPVRRWVWCFSVTIS